ncbi:MAG: AlpA family phage regulatory protein [Hyphomonas sp.]|nr:AlpA family phage regulatory protein [Hyphomonas sp.]
MSDKLLPIESVMDAIGVKRTKLYDLVTQGDFPHPVKVGALSRWPESEVDAWISRQKSKREAA